MMEERVVPYGGSPYTIRRFQDHTVAIYGPDGRMLFSWPTTAPYSTAPVSERSDAQWRTVIHGLLLARWEVIMAAATMPLPTCAALPERRRQLR